jgi:chitinase
MSRRFSPMRLLILAAIVGGLGVLSWTQASSAYQRITAPKADTWFAPYVDVTLTPTFEFEDPSISPSKDVVLAFVVADRHQRCLPTWGTYYDLDGAGRELDLDRRIQRLRERGGDVVVSFGGAVNDELAVACSDPRKLADAYRSVVDRYNLSTIDVDLEGAALGDTAAASRRATAIAALQAEATKRGKALNVWLTLPVTPAGLTDEGMAQVGTMLGAGVDLAGVNAMTMNYGGSRPAGTSMRAAAERALRGVYAQLGQAYRRVGVTDLTPRRLWAKVGATPMIGRNDVASDETSIGDARALVAFARNVHLGRVSMWSANRDDRCGAQSDSERVSNTCSGVDQDPLAFTWELSRLDATLPDRTPPVKAALRADASSRDDPATSPYPIWRAAKAYLRGDKIVWHGAVYEAKWFTKGDLPDETVPHLWDTPWRYVGPVLAADAPPAPALVPGQFRRWSADEVFQRGDKATFKGVVYQAKWWTQGDVPQPDPDRPYDVPWTAIGRAAPTVATVSATLPAWSATTTYLPSTRVAYDGYAYEARWWTKGFRPDPSPKAAAAGPWKLIGRLSTGAAAKG